MKNKILLPIVVCGAYVLMMLIAFGILVGLGAILYFFMSWIMRNWEYVLGCLILIIPVSIWLWYSFQEHYG